MAAPPPAVTPRARKYDVQWLLSPRIWCGMRLRAWLGLLQRGGWRLQGWNWLSLASITPATVLQSFGSLLQRATLERRAVATPLAQPPLFILGHWRSGTTLLHELLVRDARHAFPTTFQCLMPDQCLLTENWLPWFLDWFLPSRRPMDNMAAGLDRPQEDEFALLNAGVPTPYRSIAFPNDPPLDEDYLTLEGLSDAELDEWMHALERLLRLFSYRRRQRLILKSPPHTARVHVLARMYPEALYVHLVRNPYEVFSSTLNLWRRFGELQGLQRLRPEATARLREYVFRSLERMYARYEADRRLIAPQRLCEVRYEELVRDPVGEVRRVYEHLNLGGWDAVEPRIREYAAANQDYRRNKLSLDAPTRDEITRRWGFFCERYGYAVPELAT